MLHDKAALSVLHRFPRQIGTGTPREFECGNLAFEPDFGGLMPISRMWQAKNFVCDGVRLRGKRGNIAAGHALHADTVPHGVNVRAGRLQRGRVDHNPAIGVQPGSTGQPEVGFKPNGGNDNISLYTTRPDGGCDVEPDPAVLSLHSAYRGIGKQRNAGLAQVFGSYARGGFGQQGL